MSDTQLVWLRQDLRLDDQPAFAAAAKAGPVVALYVLDDETPGDWKIGGAQRWWLHHSLSALKTSIEEKGGALILRSGRTPDVVADIADKLKASGIHAVRHYEPWWREAEKALGDRLTLHHGDTLHEPDDIRTGSGGSFKIYGPFYRALEQRLPPAAPVNAPRKLDAPSHLPRTESLASWDLLPTKPNWAGGFDVWEPGEDAARKRLKGFAERVADYGKLRDHPGEEATSSLSPHLHWGEISPRRVWHTIREGRSDKFQRELAWRDFSRAVALNDPKVGEKEQRPSGVHYREGKRADADFTAWTRGRTGYPLVDAGMRQLWTMGWMHNRARLVTASFLVKHLLIPWWRGEQWFWDTLVDADYSNNSQNWQWIAGTGFDSQPFYRIMAPLTQSEKFDAADYIRQWVPELEHLADADIHDPHGRGVAPPGYPEPLIGHREARDRALKAFRERRTGG